MLKPWKPTLAKSAIAIAAPVVAVGVFSYHFYRLGLSGYVKELSQPDFLISQIAMVLAFAAWIARYSIPSVKFLSGKKFSRQLPTRKRPFEETRSATKSRPR
jgi:hypothetical protein